MSSARVERRHPRGGRVRSDHPAEVAFFRLEGAGTHNFWMDEERQILYAAYYNGGVVALDVSGTLSGDLADRLIDRIEPGGAGTPTPGASARERIPLRDRHAERAVAARGGPLSVSAWPAPCRPPVVRPPTSGYQPSGSIVTLLTFFGPGTIAV